MEKMQAPFRAGRTAGAGKARTAVSDLGQRQVAALITAPVVQGMATSDDADTEAPRYTHAGGGVTADASDASQSSALGESLEVLERDFDRSRASAASDADEHADGDGEEERSGAAANSQCGSSVKVSIETRDVPRGRSGRPRKTEHYPFGKLSPVTSDGHGRLTGDSFFIPDADNPARQIAAGRKRHRPKVFITRQVPGGRMVWREK